jgi:hypothetical protein
MSWFPDQDIDVKMEVPTEVRAGDEFMVTLQINKGDLESFSRYTQSLPYGLQAERVSTANADFSFDDQRIRIIWLKLPPDDRITVTYKIDVDPRLTGSFEMAGDFAFVTQNERKILSVESGHMIEIIPDSTIAESERVDINDFQILAAQEREGGFKNMEVERREPFKSGPFEFTVVLDVQKGNLSKFAKIEEYIPEGFRVVEGESKDGIFSFNQGVVKILWMNLPEEPEFSVSYRIVPDPGKDIEDFEASGTFSYITGNETKAINIEDKAAPPVDVAEIVEEGEDVTPVELPDPDTTETQEDIPGEEELADNTETSITQTEESDIEEDISDEPLARTTPPVEEENIEPSVKTNMGESSYMLKPEAGVYYRVQLAAGHNEIRIEPYFNRRKVEKDVKMEFHEGWRKYTAGSYDVYKSARDYRNQVWAETPIDGAFVTAYRNGDRITVQEALMITNQEWYR